MKFTLKDYQDDAVAKVLDQLRKGRRRWHEEGERTAFSLTAATGAGKTVMAAAVFEALFHGDDERDFDARSEEHTSELQSLMRISYAVFCLKKKKTRKNKLVTQQNHTQQQV